MGQSKANSSVCSTSTYNVFEVKCNYVYCIQPKNTKTNCVESTENPKTDTMASTKDTKTNYMEDSTTNESAKNQVNLMHSCDEITKFVIILIMRHQDTATNSMESSTYSSTN